jgi:FkbM family methyltransferase
MTIPETSASISGKPRPDPDSTVNRKDSGSAAERQTGIGGVITTTLPLKVRSPFALVHSPITVKAYIRAHRSRDRWSWKIFELSRLVTPLSKGKAAVTFGTTKREFLFNAANTQFHSIYLKRYQSGYEIETCLLLERLLNPEDTFFDVGSNWGHLSIYVASMPGYRGHIYAFEPTPASFRDLESTVTQLGLGEQISCYNVACSDAAGTGQMNVGDGLHSGIAQLSELKAGAAVTVISLDESNLPPPQVIKIDVEGAEHRVLRGGRRMIETARPFIIFEAWRGENTMAAARLLRELRYVFFWPCLSIMDDDEINYTVLAHGEAPKENNVHLSLYPWDVEYRNLFSDHFNAFACPRERIEWISSRFSHA